MKLLLALIMLISLGLQDKPKTVDIKPKAIDATTQNEILKEQLAISRIQAEFQACQSRGWGNEYSQHQTKIQALVDASFKSLNLKKEEYDLNLDTFEFVKKAAPNAPDKK